MVEAVDASELTSEQNEAPLSDEELIRLAMQLKDQGNSKFQEGEFGIAVGQYKDALSHADRVQNDTPELSKLKVTILQNMSVCTNNSEDFLDTIENCTKAVEIDSNATKAFYLRSIAHQKVNELDKAMLDIRAAILLSPQDTNLRDQLKSIKKSYMGVEAVNNNAVVVAN